MQQLQEGIVDGHGDPQAGEEDEVVPHPPRLLVMGEAGRQVEKLPRGYVFKDESGTTGLVTVDKIWQLHYLAPPLKDLCLSFALFKLLRCRFVRYELASAGSVAMTWSMLLKDGGHAMAFRVIADELSFVHDYYYSPLPISYSKHWLPILTIFISLLSIGNCFMTAPYVMGSYKSGKMQLQEYEGGKSPQIYCDTYCSSDFLEPTNWESKGFGSLYVDLVAVWLLLLLVVVAEVRDIASYVCSNWTKVHILCSYVSHASSQHAHGLQKWAMLLLQHRCKLMKHWDEKMSQCSVLELHPRKSPLALLRRLLRLPDQTTKVKVSSSVKSSIIEMLRSCHNGQLLSNGRSSLRRSRVGESFLWACNGKGTSDTILTWHIATSILEVRYPYNNQQGSPVVSTHKMVAIHLSRYCAYLVSWCPELLPDDDAWSKDLYKAVKKDAERVLAGGHAAAGPPTPEAKFRRLMEVLNADNTKHEVLRNGAGLGEQLVAASDGGEEGTAWKLLAEFWSEMILYVAPSDNLKGHSDAIARGGELITLLWALLFHAGIAGRPSGVAGEATAAATPSDDSSAGTAAGVV
ncbi:hypothetical protein ACP70R_014548 [Stipagrostis hirtigluma subsp. patula]